MVAVRRMAKVVSAIALGATTALVGAVHDSDIDAQTNQQVFGFTGAAQTFTVPPDVCQVTVDAFGAQGGAGDFEPGCAEAPAALAVPEVPRFTG